MGNMLESDSSLSSDVENDNIQLRTAGDGMESDITNLVKDASSNTNLAHPSRKDTSVPSKLQSKYSLEQYVGTADGVGGGHEKAIKNDNIATYIGTKSYGSPSSMDVHSTEASVNSLASKPNSLAVKLGTTVSTSPRQLPSRDLLIPLKPQKLESMTSSSKQVSSSASYDKFTAVGVGSGKQKNPKFVPYEPYSCATRPIVSHSGHTRKPSDSSSIISQTSTVSASDNIVTDRDKPLFSSPEPEITSASPTTDVKRRISGENTTVPGNNTHHNHHHHPSTTLLKERLKISEKEIIELHNENTRLKKLLVDSIAGSNVQSIGAINQNLVNSNAHGIHESFDNLNDELEVWRSKFLSSCVLVEQLTRDNQILSGTVSSAADIIQDLKHTTSLNQTQYENINEWFRRANNTGYSLRPLPDQNLNSDECFENCS